jgi:serine carboxypeptidase-like clade 2
MLYVEAPAGVGFSYSDNPLDYVTDDNKTAHDNYLFLQGFLANYTQYNGRDLWITGESYAGVYLPTLAENILSDPSTPIFQQFRGIMAGNPVFDCATDIENDYTIQFNLLYFHGLVSFEHFSNWTTKGCNAKKNPGLCVAIYEAAVNEIGIIDQQLTITSPQAREPSLDPDDLYQDFCTGNGTLEFVKDDPKACKNTNTGSLLTTYLNRKDVQQAIGAKATQWGICSNKIFYTPSGVSMVPYYEDFFKQKPGLAILVYSGDIDIMTVPFAITQPCLAEMNRPMMSDWQPWFVNGWTAGYVQVFDTYTYATVKGAGHETPGYQPLSALNMFSRFLTTQSLNSPSEIKRVRETAAWGEITKNKATRQSDMLKHHGVRA